MRVQYTRALTCEDWSRFNYYARRVLVIKWDDSREYYDYEFVGRLLSSKPHSISALFPRLRELTVITGRTVSLGFASAILSPSISTLFISPLMQISIHNDYRAFIADLPARCPNILSVGYVATKFFTGDIDQQRLAEIEPILLGGWRDIQRISLVSKSFTASHLKTLSNLPRLRHLQCTQSMTPTLINSSKTMIAGGFASLTSVELKVKDCEVAITFLKAIAHVGLYKLKLDTMGREVEPEDAIALASCISQFSDTLREVTLLCGLLSYKHIRALGDCRYLEILAAPIMCDHSDIDDLSLHHPNLQTLDLRSTQYSDSAENAHPELDLTCLGLLAQRCPNIRHLALELDPNVVVPANWRSKRFPQLENLEILHSQVDKPVELASFLSSISWTTLRVSGPYDISSESGHAVHGWNEVEKLVQMLQSIRRDERCYMREHSQYVVL